MEGPDLGFKPQSDSLQLWLDVRVFSDTYLAAEPKTLPDGDNDRAAHCHASPTFAFVALLAELLECIVPKVWRCRG